MQICSSFTSVMAKTTMAPELFRHVRRRCSVHLLGASDAAAKRRRQGKIVIVLFVDAAGAAVGAANGGHVSRIIIV